jgi:hypothetical protein
MTMHLVGPWLSMTGKKKSKQKWASAEQKRAAEQLQAEWQKLVSKHASVAERSNAAVRKTVNPQVQILPEAPRSTAHIPSRDSGVKGAVTVKQTPIYTGNNIIGIGTMHKSNAVPIFSDDEAKAISSMRR